MHCYLLCLLFLHSYSIHTATPLHATNSQPCFASASTPVIASLWSLLCSCAWCSPVYSSTFYSWSFASHLLCIPNFLSCVVFLLMRTMSLPHLTLLLLLMHYLLILFLGSHSCYLLLHMSVCYLLLVDIMHTICSFSSLHATCYSCFCTHHHTPHICYLIFMFSILSCSRFYTSCTCHRNQLYQIVSNEPKIIIWILW